MIRNNLWLVFAAALMVAAPLAFVACGEDEATTCETNDDCDSGEACIAGTCKASCTDSEDCETGQCAINCADSEANFCFDPCTSDTDCSNGQTCQEFCGGRLKECRTSGVVTCTEDGDCDKGQICDETSETCIAGCRTNADCEADEICNQDALGCEAACTSNSECDEDAGEVCVDGACILPDNTCGDNADCYDLGAFYCAAGQGGADNFCADVSCGVSFNNCNTCTNGPNGGARDENGPVIFNASAVSCEKTSACLADAPWACRFSFFAFDPKNDLPTTDLKNSIVRVAGGVELNFGLKTEPNGFSFHTGCFSTKENGESKAMATVALKNKSGKNSNTLCFGN